MTAAKSASHLKLAGTDRPDRAREDKPVSLGDLVTEVPDMPPWVKHEYAVDEWKRIAPIMVKAKLLTHARITLLAQMCALHGQIALAYSAGTMPPANMQATFRMMLVDLGISESQAVRAPSEPPKNSFARNGRRGK